MDKTEITYQEDLDLIENSTTKEKLIYALWIVKSHSNEKEEQIQKVVAKKQQEMKMKKINDHRTHIILRLIQEAVIKEYNADFLEKLAKEEKISILIKRNEIEPEHTYNKNILFTTFCNMYGLKESLVNYYLAIGGLQNAATIVDADLLQKKKLIEQAKQSLKRHAHRVAQEMYGILKLENHNAKNNIPTRAPQFNLYDFSEYAKQSFESFKKGLSAISEISTDHRIILTYVRKHKTIFEKLNTAKVKSITRSGVISCDGHTIRFQQSDAMKALKDMESKKMLNYRGLLFQAIERQITNPENNTSHITHVKKSAK